VVCRLSFKHAKQLAKKDPSSPVAMACCCRGGFCELVLPKDDNNSLVNGNGHLPNNKKGAASLSKREKRLQNSLERERIIGLLKWVLTNEEYLQLEETGDLVRLRAVNKKSTSQGGGGDGDASVAKSSDHHDGFWIDGESVNLAKKEHRPNLARLAFAEFQSLSSSNHHYSSSSDDSEPTTIALPTCSGNEGDVAVCEVCFNVYTLLKQARKLLLASSHRVTEEDQDEANGNNPPADKAANNSALNGKIGGATNKLGKHTSNVPIRSSKEPASSSSAVPGRGPTTSPQHKSDDNDNNQLKSKRKEKQKKRDRDKMEKNAKIHVLVAESDEVRFDQLYRFFCLHTLAALTTTLVLLLFHRPQTFWPSESWKRKDTRWILLPTARNVSKR